MSSPQIERKLAAIMFTDIAGYTEQMSKDEAAAMSLLETKKKVFRPLLKKYNGKLVKEMGDGTLSHFPSSVDAANCSIELQKSLKKNTNLNVRVGVHHGEVLFKDKDVYGDVVNIASRLETMSPAGGVLVSKNVYDELSNRKGYEGVSLGLQSMKGVGRLIEVFGLKGDKLSEPNPNEYQDNKIDKHTYDEVPSIAIIPFENKGADEDVFYAYGISVDLISDVTSAGLIRVASKKQIEDAGELLIDELAKKLDVRYIANGELWRMGDMLQLSVELYDTKDKKVVWSDRWEERWDNLPSIKGSLSDGLLKALDTKPKVEKKVETTNPEAYEFYLKAKHKYEKCENTDDTEIARGLLQKAIELDDNLIAAKVLLGSTYREMGDYDKAMEIYTSALKHAEELGDKLGMGYSIIGIGIVHSEKGDLDTSLDYFERALEIKEELGDKLGMGVSLHNIGSVYYYKGDYDKTLDYLGRSLAIREELGDKRGMGASLNNIGAVCRNKGDYEKGLDYYGRSLAIREEIGDKRGMGISLMSIGAVYFNKGDYDKALDYYERSLAIDEELGDKRGMGYSLMSIGAVYYNKGDLDTALDYYNRSLAIREEFGDKSGMGITLANFGSVYFHKGDYDSSLDYYERSIKIREKLGDKNRLGESFSNIGLVYWRKGDLDTALDYYERSLKIFKEIGDKYGMGASFTNIGLVYGDKGDYDTALDYYERSLAIDEELGDKDGMGNNLNNIGLVYWRKGENDSALDYYERSMKIREKLGDKNGMGITLNNIGIVYWHKGDNDKVFSHLQKAVNIQKEIGTLELETVTLFALAKKNHGKEYDKDEILKLIKESEHIEYYLNYYIFQLLEDTSYLETAYNQVQENASEMEEELKAKFLSYPIPKAIVEEWDKVK